jgi:rod shape-determining protein MreC
LKSQNDALAIETQAKKVFYLLLLILFPLQNWKIKDKQPYDIVVSKVIHNSYNVHENYLTLNSGALQALNLTWAL